MKLAPRFIHLLFAVPKNYSSFLGKFRKGRYALAAPIREDNETASFDRA
jgi:hypothetical protein